MPAAFQAASSSGSFSARAPWARAVKITGCSHSANVCQSMSASNWPSTTLRRFGCAFQKGSPARVRAVPRRLFTCGCIESQRSSSPPPYPEAPRIAISSFIFRPQKSGTANDANGREKARRKSASPAFPFARAQSAFASFGVSESRTDFGSLAQLIQQEFSEGFGMGAGVDTGQPQGFHEAHAHAIVGGRA